MNDFSELENQLKKLRLIEPSENLLAAIDRDLNQPNSPATAAVLPRPARFQFNWGSIGLGLAASAALLLFLFLNLDRNAKDKNAPGPTTPAVASRGSSQFVPAGLTRVVYHTRDEGLHFRSGAEQPMRRTRSLTRETMLWRNPTTGASLRVSYPSEEVSLTPVSGQ
jgi:hypothetical protein